MSSLEFDCVPPPIDVDDAASAADYLEMLNEIQIFSHHILDEHEHVRELLIGDIQHGIWAIAEFLRTGKMPETADLTPDNVDALVEAFTACFKEATAHGNTQLALIVLGFVQHAAGVARERRAA